MLNLQVTSDINPTGLEKRFDESVVLKDLKNKLVLITGVETDSMVLELYVDNQSQGELTDENQLLGDAVGESNSGKQLRIHVKDKSEQSLNLIDSENMQKYEMSHDAYAKRENTLLHFKKQNKLGRFADDKE